jgi:hypothetical protein
VEPPTWLVPDVLFAALVVATEVEQGITVTVEFGEMVVVNVTRLDPDVEPLTGIVSEEETRLDPVEPLTGVVP